MRSRLAQRPGSRARSARLSDELVHLRSDCLARVTAGWWWLDQTILRRVDRLALGRDRRVEQLALGGSVAEHVRLARVVHGSKIYRGRMRSNGSEQLLHK